MDAIHVCRVLSMNVLERHSIVKPLLFLIGKVTKAVPLGMP